MIASNYRKHAAAAAVQRVLAMGRPVWALSRPSTRILRAIRNARGNLIKVTPQLVEWMKKVTPDWVKQMAKRAKALVNDWKSKQMELPIFGLEEKPAQTTTAPKKQAITTKPVSSWSSSQMSLEMMMEIHEHMQRAAEHSGEFGARVLLRARYWMTEEEKKYVFGGYQPIRKHPYTQRQCAKTQGYRFTQ